MFTINSVGIVGLGFVGSAVKNAHQKNSHLPLHTFDIVKESTCSNLAELTKKSDLIYVCVPTPMAKNGACDTTIVENVVSVICENTSGKVIVIKSTVTPGTTQKLQQKYNNNIICFNPEFLTEANSYKDFLHQKVCLLGIDTMVDSFIKTDIFNNIKSVIDTVEYSEITTPIAAEFFKYAANTFLATKVSFANEMFTLAQSLNLDWEHFSNILQQDTRLGKTHWKVPGPDGKFGWGGSCFPKDLSALLVFAKQSNISMPLLKAVWDRNEDDREK